MDYDLNSNDYYKILGISRNSDLKTIKKAYHKLAIKYHPDKHLDKKEEYEQLFKKIYHAYQQLSNSYERKHFDNFSNNKTTFNQSNNDSNMFNSFFSSSNNGFENETFSYNFSNLDGSIDVNFNYSTYTNFDDEYKKMKNDLNKFKIFESTIFDYGQIIKIQNSTKVIIKSKKLQGYVKDFNNGFYLVHTDNGDEEIHFDDIQQILKGKLTDLKGDYSHLNGDYCDLTSYNSQFDRFMINIYDCDLVINLDNIIINNDSYVKIHNLKNNTDLNNTWGLILAFDLNSKKYLIKIDKNKKVKVSFKNVIF